MASVFTLVLVLRQSSENRSKELGRNDSRFGHISKMEITICGRRSSFTGNFLVCECGSGEARKKFRKRFVIMLTAVYQTGELDQLLVDVKRCLFCIFYYIEFVYVFSRRHLARHGN